jgi:hypothetical protein
MEAKLIAEASALGVSVIAFYEVMHEAWRGYPRIHVATGTSDARLLRHEALHALLHGSLDYYIVACPNDISAEALQIASTVVKDLEVALEAKRCGLGDVLEYQPGEVYGDCCSPEVVSDELRAATIQLARGEKPTTRCALATVVKALHELVASGERPWTHVCRVAKLVDDYLRMCRS